MAGDEHTPVSPMGALQPKEVPAPPKRSKSSRHGFVVVMNFMMSCAVFATILLCGVVYLGKYIFEKEGPLNAPQTVLIEGEGHLLHRFPPNFRQMV